MQRVKLTIKWDRELPSSSGKTLEIGTLLGKSPGASRPLEARKPPSVIPVGYLLAIAVLAAMLFHLTETKRWAKSPDVGDWERLQQRADLALRFIFPLLLFGFLWAIYARFATQ